jgi:hypothetical protein
LAKAKAYTKRYASGDQEQNHEDREDEAVLAKEDIPQPTVEKREKKSLAKKGQSKKDVNINTVPAEAKERAEISLQKPEAKAELKVEESTKIEKAKETKGDHKIEKNTKSKGNGGLKKTTKKGNAREKMLLLKKDNVKKVTGEKKRDDKEEKTKSLKRKEVSEEKKEPPKTPPAKKQRVSLSTQPEKASVDNIIPTTRPRISLSKSKKG